MITDNSQCPAWIRELVRFTPLKNLLFVYGNVYDRVSYPVAGSDSAISWSESELQTFFRRFLELQGYGLIGFFDPLDGLSFPNTTMENLYKKLHRGKSVEAPRQQEQQMSSRQAASCAKTDDNTEDDELIQFKPGDTDPLRAVDMVIDGIRKTLNNDIVSSAFVFNLASRLVTSPSYLQSQEKNIFTRMLKASLTAKTVTQGDIKLNNVIILVCEKLNDLPAFLYLNNPRARSIHLPKPDSADRSRYFERSHQAFYKLPTQQDAKPTSEMSGAFAALTEGLTYYEMASLVNLSLIEKLPITEAKGVQKLCERFKYGITESEWDKIGRDRLANAEEKIRERVKGQHGAVMAALDIIKRAKIGLAAGSSGKTNRPRGVLFFAGPTGVGKTEMAKTLAELLFGQEERCLRFDMSEYSAAQSDQRLLGAPPGYVGYEEGGQLTTAVRENPFSILLFDEIEKAHGSIFDKFLQILDDGRLTDGKGETVYFSECIIIFTSNLGSVTDTASGRSAMITPDMPYQTMRDKILTGIRDHFNFTLGRPEVLNRIGDNFVVFDFIRPPLDEEIVDLLIEQLKKATLEGKRIALEIAKPVRDVLLIEVKKHLQHGGRGIRNVIDTALVNPLNRILFDMGIERDANVRLLFLEDHGEAAPVRFELKVESTPRCS